MFQPEKFHKPPWQIDYDVIGEASQLLREPSVNSICLKDGEDNDIIWACECCDGIHLKGGLKALPVLRMLEQSPKMYKVCQLIIAYAEQDDKEFGFKVLLGQIIDEAKEVMERVNENSEWEDAR